MAKGSRARKSSGKASFIVGVIACFFLIGVLAWMLLFFHKNPTLAPPGICRYIALAVPAALLLCIFLSLLRKTSRKGRH